MNNPFTSKRYKEIWLKHFNGSKSAESFSFIDQVAFIKKGLLPFYVNVGRNLTKGIFYSINEDHTNLKGKTCLIYDVPTYFNVKDAPQNSGLKVKRIFQYNGFLMNLKDFEDTDAYIKSRFSGKNRREFRSNFKRLETCFNIEYKFFYQKIDKAEFDVLFSQFHELLSYRFSEKQTEYHHLGEEKWSFYSDLVFEMINESRASLLVIFKDDKPIGITLNFHSEDIVFETITVFDPDFYKFGIGKVSIIKLLDWCFEHDISISDFSKGDFDYKRKWGNEVYDFEYHIIYDSRSLQSLIMANGLELFFKLKLKMRKRKLNTLYRKFRFSLGGGNKPKIKPAHFNIEHLKSFENDGSFEKINLAQPEEQSLRKYVYTFLYAHPELESNINVYKNKISNCYIIEGSEHIQKLTIS